MIKKGLIITMMIVGLIGCSDEGKFVDASYLKGGFTGITYTDVDGKITGPVDEDDWRLHYGPINLEYSLKSSDDLRIPPDYLKIEAAYPNPFNGMISLRFVSDGLASFYARVYNNDMMLVYESPVIQFEYSGLLNIPGKNLFGNNLAEGVYRVYYSITLPGLRGTYSGHGDIMVVYDMEKWNPDSQ